MSRRAWSVIIGVGTLILVAQIIPFPPAENPPVTGEIQAPAEAQPLLERSCYDCHSNETTWPWYSHVIPTKWFVRQHVREGREHLNFSEWNRYSAYQSRDQLEEIVEVLEDGEMPLRSYTRLHEEAVLSAEEVETLLNWARGGG